MLQALWWPTKLPYKGRAKPVAAGEEELSARGQVVGAHDVPRVCRQGQGVDVHAHSRGVRAAAAAGANFDSETSVGSPMAATTLSAPRRPESTAICSAEAASVTLGVAPRVSPCLLASAWKLWIRL